MTELLKLYRNRECRYCLYLRKNDCINGNVCYMSINKCEYWIADRKKIRKKDRSKIKIGDRVKLSYNKRRLWNVTGILKDKVKIRMDIDNGRFEERVIDKKRMKKITEKNIRNGKTIKENIYYFVEYELK